MRKVQGSFCLPRETLQRLQHFSKSSGIPQSVLVERMLSRGLDLLETHWKTTDQVLDEVFGSRTTPRSEVLAEPVATQNSGS